MKGNWDIDFENFTIVITGDITAQDCGKMMNAMAKHERDVIEDWHKVSAKWKVVTNVSENTINDDTERPSNESV